MKLATKDIMAVTGEQTLEKELEICRKTEKACCWVGHNKEKMEKFRKFMEGEK